MISRPYQARTLPETNASELGMETVPSLNLVYTEKSYVTAEACRSTWAACQETERHPSSADVAAGEEIPEWFASERGGGVALRPADPASPSRIDPEVLLGAWRRLAWEFAAILVAPMPAAQQPPFAYPAVLSRRWEQSQGGLSQPPIWRFNDRPGLPGLGQSLSHCTLDPC